MCGRPSAPTVANRATKEPSMWRRISISFTEQVCVYRCWMRRWSGVLGIGAPGSG